MIRVLYADDPAGFEAFGALLRPALERRGVAADLATDFAPGEVDYIVYAPSSALKDFRPYTRARAVLNLWAGVEGVVRNETLTQPLCRMVEPGLTEGMTEWVTGHVLRHHLGMDRHLSNPDHVWDDTPPPLARDRTVAVLGLGELGLAAARALAALNFRVLGWSRSGKDVAGIETFSGRDGLARALSRAEILVLLLPLTADTGNLIGTEALSMLPRGAVILNPGRGALIDDDALLAALDRGHVGQATLDVFRVEPLPADHPFWAHPRVTVTPHIASATRMATAAETVAENIRRGEAGEPFLHLVDRARGY